MNLLGILLAAVTTGAPAEGSETEVSLRFVTAPPAAEISAAIERAELTQDIVIETTEAVTDVRVAAEPLTGPEVVPLQCTIAGQPCDRPFEIEAHGARTVRLTGAIELAGQYRSVVSLTNGKTRRSVVLKVTRTTTPFPLELIDPIHAAATSDAQITIEVSLQEKLGRDAILNPPALALVRQDVGKTARREADYRAAIEIGDKKIPDPWMVARRSAPVMQLKFDRLDEAGTYVGRLRLTSPSTPQRLDIPLSIAVKDHWFTAALLIFIGALLSFALRTYLKDLRPRLLQQRTTAILIGDLERLRREITKDLGKLEDAEAAVIGALSDRLAKTADQIELGPAPEASDALREIDFKLSLVRRWINARRRAAVLTAPPAALGALLEGVAAYLSSEGAQGTDEALKRLSEAEAAVRAALVTELNKRSEALSTSISGSSMIDAAARAPFLERLAVANGMTDLETKREALANLESDVVLQFTEELSRRIGAATKPPRGFTPDSWKALVDNVGQKLEAVRTAAAPRRAAAYQSAYRDYLSGVAAALDESVQEAIRLITAKMKVDNREPEKRQAVISDLQARMKAIRDHLEADKLDDAQKAIRDLNKVLDNLGTGATAGFLGGPGQLPAEEAAPAANAAPAAVARATTAEVDIAGIALRRMRLAGLSAKRITRLIEGLDVVVFLIGLIVATASGVYLLWSSDPTWGSAEDKLVALLWGLGVQRVSDTLFEGVGGTLKKFSA